MLVMVRELLSAVKLISADWLSGLVMRIFWVEVGPAPRNTVTFTLVELINCTDEAGKLWLSSLIKVPVNPLWKFVPVRVKVTVWFFVTILGSMLVILGGGKFPTAVFAQAWLLFVDSLPAAS